MSRTTLPEEDNVDGAAAAARAQMLLTQGQYAEAERVIGPAVQQLLEQGEQWGLLAQALTTQGVARARLGQYSSARRTLDRASTTAEQAGALELAGRAALASIEELSAHVERGELCAYYLRAAALLTETQDPSIASRLHTAAGIVIQRLQPQPTMPAEAPLDWRGYSLRRTIHRYERMMIGRALQDADGMVSHAAKLLGFKYHQSLISLLNHRHQDLLPARLPILRRSRKRGRVRRAGGTLPRPVSMLHVEDNELIADTVRDALALEGWRVVTCVDGATALDRLMSNEPYDLLLVDFDLPGMDGLELVRQARQLAHREHTPIIMLSASAVEHAAQSAGVDVYLRKPEDVPMLIDTITRLLRVRASNQ